MSSAPNKHSQEAHVKSTPGSQEVQIRWESSLPPPAVLADYEKVLPGSADRYFSMIEDESEHRRKEEVRELDMTIKLSSRGMILGFIVNIAALGTAVALAALSMNGAAIAAVVSAALTNLIFFSSFTHKAKDGRETQKQVTQL